MQPQNISYLKSPSQHDRICPMCSLEDLDSFNPPAQSHTTGGQNMCPTPFSHGAQLHNMQGARGSHGAHMVQVLGRMRAGTEALMFEVYDT